MSEFAPVLTADDLDSLCEDDIVAGYRSGLVGDPMPGSDKSRGFWHGWRNGMTDSGRVPLDFEQEALARALYGNLQ